MGYHTTSTALQDVVPQLTGLSAGLPDAPATIGPSPAPAGRPLEPPLPAPAAAPGRPKGAPAAPVVISPPPPETPLPEVPAAPPLEVFPALPLAPASHRTTPRHGDKPRPRKRKEALPSTATGPSAYACRYVTRGGGARKPSSAPVRTRRERDCFRALRESGQSTYWGTNGLSRLAPRWPSLALGSQVLECQCVCALRQLRDLCAAPLRRAGNQDLPINR